MAIVPQSPSSALFGNEIADDFAKTKATQKQCIEALKANGISVALPTEAIGDTPIDQLHKTNKAILVAMGAEPAVGASINLKNAGLATLLTLTAILPGTAGNAIQVKIEAGSISGKKITIDAEVYDDVADVAGAVTAIQGVSLLVNATLVLEGTLANIAFTNLSGGEDIEPIPVTLPDFGEQVKTVGDQQCVDVASGTGAMNDFAFVRASKTAQAIFDALRTALYIK